jgi:hypothetical protein
VRARRLWTVVCAATLALGISACGHKQAHPHVADANNNGDYVDAGPITYQLQISRELNPYDDEDAQYLAGLPPGTVNPGATQFWYGVFLWAINQTHHVATTADKFEIVDTQGNHYYPIKLDTGMNQYAWRSTLLAPLGTQPAPGTAASNGPTQGQVLLFKLNDTAYSNRPLTLFILSSTGRKLAAISLDL